MALRPGRSESGLRPRRWPPPPALAIRCRALAEAVGTWIERIRTRRRLGHLSDHLLKDIGLSHAEVARETEKPFWRK
jgi:uncharacterized protein YjiS (DUF1127 family)